MSRLSLYFTAQFWRKTWKFSSRILPYCAIIFAWGLHFWVVCEPGIFPINSGKVIGTPVSINETDRFDVLFVADGEKVCEPGIPYLDIVGFNPCGWARLSNHHRFFVFSGKLQNIITKNL